MTVLVPGTLLVIAFDLERTREETRASQTASAIAEARRCAYRAQVESWFASALAAAEMACGETGADPRHLSIAGPLGASLDVISDGAGSIIAPIRLDVRVIIASPAGALIDPLLRGEPFFRQAPLDRFGSLRVASHFTTELHPEQPRELAVPGSAPLIVTVDRTLARSGRMRVRMTRREQPAFVAASRGEWFLWVAGASSPARPGSMVAMRLGEASRDSWRLVDDALVRAVSCGDLRAPLSPPLELGDGATLVISDGADPATEPTIELHGHRFVLSHSRQDPPVGEHDDRAVEVLVLSAFSALGLFAYLAGVRFSKRTRDEPM